MDFLELRQKFNPDGSLLRRHQLRVIELLDYVDYICKRYNINYWLDSGTLLGAARHEAFIPWDDDIDIQMLKSDYKRFVKLMKKKNPFTNIALQIQSTDRGYIFPFAKVRDLNSHITESSGIGYKYNGIFIDIFPLERNLISLLKLSFRLNIPLLKFFYNKKNKGGFRNIFFSVYLFLLNRIIYPLLRFISFIFKPKYHTHTLGVNFFKTRMIDEIFPLKKIYFEGKEYPCPNNTDNYLTRLYGDYKKVPDMKDIHFHVTEVLFKNED